MSDFRNAFALHAKSRAAGPMKDRRAPRGGQRNEQADLMNEYYDELIVETNEDELHGVDCPYCWLFVERFTDG